MLNLDIQWFGEYFVSHEAVDLFRIEVIDLAIQNCFPCSIQQSIYTLTDNLQPEVLSSHAFWQIDQSRHHDQIASGQMPNPLSPILP